MDSILDLTFGLGLSLKYPFKQSLYDFITSFIRPKTILQKSLKFPSRLLMLEPDLSVEQEPEFGQK